MARILVVDDEESMRQLVRDMLESENHEVIDADNGNEAIVLQRITHADVVITNILMPEKEGLETIRDLLTEFPGQPIIAMSGGGQYGTMTYLDIARSLGAGETLDKPFTKTQLLSAIDSLMAAPDPSTR